MGSLSDFLWMWVVSHCDRNSDFPDHFFFLLVCLFIKLQVLFLYSGQEACTSSEAHVCQPRGAPSRLSFVMLGPPCLQLPRVLPAGGATGRLRGTYSSSRFLAAGVSRPCFCLVALAGGAASRHWQHHAPVNAPGTCRQHLLRGLGAGLGPWAIPKLHFHNSNSSLGFLVLGG